MFSFRDSLLAFSLAGLVTSPNFFCLFLAPLPLRKGYQQGKHYIKDLIHLMTSGSSSSICWLRIGVDENADGCGRGANGGGAPKVDETGGG